MARRVTRRRFLRESTALGASVLLAGASTARSSALERVNVGVIGVAHRGAANLKGVSGENVVALCDVDTNLAASARDAFPKAKFFQDYRKLLELKEIDAVVVSTPDHMHAIPAVTAMRLGKHLYCEKPLAHSVHEVRVMMRTAAETKVVTQMGTQIHAQDNYRRVVEIVRAGVLGKIGRVQVWCSKRPREVHVAQKPMSVPASLDYDLWLGPAPYRPYDSAHLPVEWRWWWDFGGGILADMACHYMDLPHWALELRAPATIAANGKKVSRADFDVPDLLQVDYHYPARGELPPVHLTWYSGVRGPDLDGKVTFPGFASGVLFEGEKGKLLADYDHLRLLPEEQFKNFTPPAKSIPPSIGHHREWLQAIKNGGTTTCSFAYSGALAETVLLGNVAFRSGKKLEWDDQAGKATNAPEAAKYLQQEYRKGWTL